MSNLTPVTVETFQEEVLNSPIPVVVDFWAEWCGPCKQFSPIIDSVADFYNGRLKFVSVDIEAQRELLELYNIQSIPTCIVFAKGEEVHRFQGASSKIIVIAELGKFVKKKYRVKQ